MENAPLTKIDNDDNYQFSESLMDSSEKSVYLDTLIEKDESTFMIVKHIIAMTLTHMIWAIGFISFYIIVITYIKEFNLTPLEVSYLINLCNIGQISSVVFIKPINKYLDKSFSLALFSFIMFLLMLTEALVNTLVIISINRFLIGIIISVILCNAFTIVVEYIPNRLRGILLSFPWLGQKLAPLLTILLFYIYNENLSADYSKTKNVLIILCLFPLFYSIIYFFFIEEGPRDLIVRNKIQEAKQTLEILHKGSLSDIQMNKIINEVRLNCSNDEEDNHHFSRLFNNRSIRKLTILVSSIKLLGSIFIGGWAVAISILVSQEKLSFEEKDTQSGLSQILTISLIQVPIILIAFLSDHSSFGRLGLMRISCIICLVFNITMLFVDSYYISYLIGICNLSMSCVTLIITNYVNEIYPNDLRSVGVSFSIIPDSLGTIISQIIYAYLSYYGLKTTIIFSIIVCLTTFILCVLLNQEPRGVKLGSFSHERKLSSKKQVIA